MVDMLKSTREEDQRKRDEAQFYSMQQQLDELRRQMKENLARQQWFEELYKQSEGKVSQLQLAQDRLTQDVAQTLQARQVDEGRMKAQLADLVKQVEAPEKQMREMRSKIQELVEGRKADQDADLADQQQMDDFQRQLRDINTTIGQIADAQRQLRDLIHELDSKMGEVRGEALHLAELQSAEEQRLRRQGVELQGLFEAMRQQFNDVSAKSQRVDDVRRQLGERLDMVEERLGIMHGSDTTLTGDLDRIENMVNEHYVAQQERLEAIRTQLEAQASEMRQVNDQRMDRIMSRFTGTDDRLRNVEQILSELPGRFEALERSDEMIVTEADTIEEWLVMRQMAALEDILEQVRKRREERATTLNTNPNLKLRSERKPGSVYNPAGLLKSVRDAKPPSRRKTDEHSEE
jgi:DNA repair exonuclease SbcCD ATPase subunit